MAREFSTVFHARGLRRKFLEELGWRAEDFSDFQVNLPQHKPEALFLDLFINGYTGTPDAQGNYRNLLWWRERAPALARDQWFAAALGYARALEIPRADAAALAGPQVLLVDFWERELESASLVEALALSAKPRASGGVPVQWICWSTSVLENWQRDGLDESEAKETRLDAFFRAQGLAALFVPVTDPLGALAAAKKIAAAPAGEAGTVLVLPSFGNEKLVHANWLMKTNARYTEAMEQT